MSSNKRLHRTCCSSLQYTITQKDVENKRTFRLAASNQNTAVLGGFTLRIAYDCNLAPPPVCPSVQLSSQWLPPDGKQVTLTLSALPGCTSCSTPEVRIINITTNGALPSTPRGQGPLVMAQYSTDWVSGGSVSFSLAAIRSGSKPGGRTYFVAYEAVTLRKRQRPALAW